MNAFTLLGFEPSLDINDVELQSRFEHLRTQFHPDRFASGSTLERRLAVQRAADINAAYATLSNPLARAQAYFALHGIVLDEQQSMNDTAFLLQQMELREALDDAHTPQARQTLKNQINVLWAQSWASLSNTAHHEDAAIILRDLQRLQFLQRFLQQI
ncbi:MAG: Fe-S protein assembly co-chaperone HscB [Halothiobacillaceae bacterium]